MERPFQILCLSGGGYLGLYTASVLEKIELSIGRPIASCFDLIAGTSVGGIIALGLAAGAPAGTIRKAFEDNGTSVFSAKPPAGRIRTIFGLLSTAHRAKYRQENLRKIISEIVDPARTVASLTRRVLIPAVNLSKGQPQMFKTPHHETFVRDGLLAVVDVALATSAAPSFFPLARISGALFADGGLYANSPDFMALHEAEHFLKVPRSAVRILSVGTTTSNFSFSNAGGTDLGWFDWMKGQRLPSVMIASQQFVSDAMLKHVLGEQYLRIDELQSKEQERNLALDVATKSAKQDLLALSEASVQRLLANPRLQAMLAHEAPEQKFKQ